MNKLLAMTAAAVAMTLPAVLQARPAVDPPAAPTSAVRTHDKTSIHASGGQALEFHDAQGKTISQQAFVAASKQGLRFTMTPDKKSGRIVMKLLPPGVNTPGSHSLGDASKEKMAQTPKPGTHFPAVNLPRLGSGLFAGAAATGGKPLLVDFFFAECVGCIAELPVLNDYAWQHPQQAVLAITFDDAGTAQKFVDERHFDWPVAYGGGKFIQDAGVKAFPTMVVVGADGTVLATRVGARSDQTADELAQWVDDALEKAK